MDFGVVGFRCSGVLDGLLGLILAPLGPIWFQNGSQNRVPRWLQIDPTTAILANKRHRFSLPELSKKLLFPKWLQDGSTWPREAQDSLLGAFLGLQKLSCKPLDPKNLEKPMVF